MLRVTVMLGGWRTEAAYSVGELLVMRYNFSPAEDVCTQKTQSHSPFLSKETDFYNKLRLGIPSLLSPLPIYYSCQRQKIPVNYYQYHLSP